MSVSTTGCPGSESAFTTAEKGVELNTLAKSHSIIHMLLINANGEFVLRRC